MTDPLPVLEMRFQDRVVHVLFDTGADMCIIDSETAQELGLGEITSATGAFGGGRPARVGFSRLPSLQIGGVTLADVPVMTLPTKRFSSIFGDGKLAIEGIIGTGLARQFLTTIDYERNRMVLRERAPQSLAAVRHELGERILAEMPFVMSSTHQMMARGSINGQGGLTFFVDSGLASEASLAAPPQTLEYLGLPKPQTRIDPRGVGGGGGKYATGVFPIESLGLGNLLQHNLQGEFGSRTAGSYWEAGFIQDGLISHQFLRQYASWTLDFDAFQYIFAK
jgi:predicted aspartyl protease